MLDLKDIKAREKAASPGPWEMESVSVGEYFVTSIHNADGNWDESFGFMKLSHDAEFVSNARADIPALIAEVERLTKMLRNEGYPDEVISGIGM